MSAQSIGLTLWCATMLCVIGSTCGAMYAADKARERLG